MFYVYNKLIRFRCYILNQLKVKANKKCYILLFVRFIF